MSEMPTVRGLLEGPVVAVTPRVKERSALQHSTLGLHCNFAHLMQAQLAGAPLSPSQLLTIISR